MAGLSLNHPWAFTFGILGNIISFLVYLSPLPTFYRVYKKKSTEGFHSVPYVVALFSATLWIFYALLKTDACLLVTINSVGCVIESAYLAVFFFYAPRAAKLFTAKLVFLVNVVLFGCILALTLAFSEGNRRVQILGWICMIFSVSVFVAPLSVIRIVVRTKSVEFMPFWLSFFLTITAIVWFAYGLLTKDTYVALPNVLGFVFGILQMVLYIAYKDGKRVPVVAEHGKLPEHIVSIGKVKGVAENIYPKLVAIKAENGTVGADQKIETGGEQVEVGIAAPQKGEEDVGMEQDELGMAATKGGEENVEGVISAV